MYRALDADKIIATIDLLQRRIDERFPALDLAAVAGDLSAAARDTEPKAKALARPHLLIQLAVKRHEALKAFHQLRSLVHVIDMHQLTKDPSLVLGTERVKDTAASPKRVMTAFELGRYLDYCSEMLSLTGKVAALYAQDLDDPVVVEAVNDIEMLATNLSRKVWQEIAILQASELGQKQIRAIAE